jgi:hypothetical protein
LINAQEAECSSVARDLHDNIGQSLAMFSMELQRIKLALTHLSPEDEAKFASLTARLKPLGRKANDFSHRLHSSELELFGIAVAVKVLCREFSEQYQMQALYKCSGVLDNLSAAVSLPVSTHAGSPERPVDPFTLSILELIDRLLRNAKILYMLIGAIARDLLLYQRVQPRCDPRHL